MWSHKETPRVQKALLLRPGPVLWKYYKFSNLSFYIVEKTKQLPFTCGTFTCLSSQQINQQLLAKHNSSPHVTVCSPMHLGRKSSSFELSMCWVRITKGLGKTLFGPAQVLSWINIGFGVMEVKSLMPPSWHWGLLLHYLSAALPTVFYSSISFA